MTLLSSYHLSGLANALFLLLSSLGLFLQVRFIHQRGRKFRSGLLGDERPTSAISLNRFSASFLSYYSLMVYGLCLEVLNSYLVWPRVLAVILLQIIFAQALLDRKDYASTSVFVAGGALLVFALFVRVLSSGGLAYSAFLAKILVVIAIVFLLQGAIHQVLKIRRLGRTGGLSLPMHQLFFLKDFSSILFGGAMGLQYGWPLLLFSSISIVIQSIIMWHFHWVKTAAVAAGRRA